MVDRTPASALVGGLVATGRASRLVVVDLSEIVLCAAWLVVAVTGWFPSLVAMTARVRDGVTRQRELALEYSGVDVPRTYRHDVVRRATYLDNGREMARQLADPAVRGDLWWHLYNPVVGALIAIAPAALVLEIVWGLAQPAIQPTLGNVIDGAWPWGIPARPGVLSYVVAAVSLALTYPILRWACPWLLNLHARWVRRRLATAADTADLRRRVDELAATRRTALDLQAAELLRIERDLHDGAQAKLVAIGMNLGAVEALVESDPEAARALIARLRDTSSAALDELRSLVRGIVPPVLADRGLLEALRALAADHELEVTVTGEYPRRLPTPLESALYFATSECLTNAAKHSGGTRAEVRLDQTPELTQIVVVDDGRGGAAVYPGGGLDGVRRRLEPSDGRLEVDSPAGGPTHVTITAPHPVAARDPAT